MAIGHPVMLSNTNTNEILTKGLERIKFSRQDQSSFKEDLLQNLVDRAPEVLPIQDFYPHVQSVRSLGCEIPLDLGGGRAGFIDNLLVTNDGHLVLVETKLYRNSEAIREAVIQTLEYGMTIHKMDLLELEKQIRSKRDTQGNRLKDGETIRDRAASMNGFSDDFEIVLERYLRTGEILLLVVADGIRDSVKRITHWMNENGSNTPIKFGLVELHFYELPDGKKVVVPKTLLMTKEISRHVVIVEVQNKTTANVSHTIVDEPMGKVLSKSRPAKSTPPSLTKELLLASVATEIKPTVEELLEQMVLIGLESSTKGGASVRYGITYPEEGEFLPLFYFYTTGVNAYFPKRLLDLLGSDALSEFRNQLRQFAPFWTDRQMADPYTIGSIVRYEQLQGKIKNIIDVLEAFKIRAISALTNEAEAP